MSTLEDQAYFWEVTPHQIQAVSSSGNNPYGVAEQNVNTTRIYRCYIQRTDKLQWTAQGVNHGMPMSAWVLSIPLGQNYPVPILDTDKLTILIPANTEVRRIGSITSVPDERNQLFSILIGFE